MGMLCVPGQARLWQQDQARATIPVFLMVGMEVPAHEAEWCLAWLATVITAVGAVLATAMHPNAVSRTASQ